MKNLILISILFSLSIGCSKTDLIEETLDKMVGKWQFTTYQIDGNDLMENPYTEYYVTIEKISPNTGKWNEQGLNNNIPFEYTEYFELTNDGFTYLNGRSEWYLTFKGPYMEMEANNVTDGGFYWRFVLEKKQ